MTPGDAEVASGDRSRPGARERTAAEWITLGLGAAVLTALVGLILYQYLSAGDEPAAIEVTLLFEEMRMVAGRYYLPAQVHNTGDRAANDVRVEVALGDGADGGVERAPITVQFLDGDETARAVLVLSRDPREVGVRVDVLSYLEP